MPSMQVINWKNKLAMVTLNIVASVPIAYYHLHNSQHLGFLGEPVTKVDLSLMWSCLVISIIGTLVVYTLARRLISDDNTTPPPPPPGSADISSLWQFLMTIASFLVVAAVMFLPILTNLIFGGSIEPIPFFLLNFFTFIATPLAGRQKWKSN